MLSRVMITGGLSGLGFALAQHFLKQSLQVDVTFRTDDELHRLRLQELQAMGEVEAFSVDLLKSKETLAWARQQLSCANYDLWINNAATSCSSLLVKTSQQDFDNVMMVNAKHTMQLTRLVVAAMAQRGLGHMINILSHQAWMGYPGLSAYAASKGFLLGLTQDLAREYGADNVRVNGVCPGFMETGMTEGLTEQEVNVFRSANTLGRFNTMEQIVQAIGDIARWEHVSGQVFVLDSRVG